SYFEDVSLNHGKTITSISLYGLATGTYQQLSPSGSLANSFLLTIVNKKDDVLLWQYPLCDLVDFTSSGAADTEGKQRLFELENVDFKKSYVTYIFPSVLSSNICLLFNFFSVD